MHNFKEIRIWNESMTLAKIVYSHTKQFPKEERYGLTQQINKCVVSVPSNIAEGAGRNTNKDFKQFIAIALGSAFELETQLILSRDFGYISSEEFDPLIQKLISLQKMNNKFRISLE
jgi:four helix bundle protein